MSYEPLTIYDSTPFDVDGTVEYNSIFCRTDTYQLTPYVPWTNGRGVCLVTKLTATVHTPYGDFEATPYGSAGTLSGTFAIIQTGKTTFIITRIADGSEDQRPEGYVEPTTQQK